MANHLQGFGAIGRSGGGKDLLGLDEFTTETAALERKRLSATFLQPFISYTFPFSTSVTVQTESTYDWTARHWSIPVSASVSQLLKIGQPSFSVGLGGKYWAERPAGAPTWGDSAAVHPSAPHLGGPPRAQGGTMCIGCNPGVGNFMQRQPVAPQRVGCNRHNGGRGTAWPWPRAQTDAYPAVSRPGQSSADTIFVGSPIITMDPAAPVAEALAISDGRIMAVGRRDNLMNMQGAGTKIVNLGGTAILPGFTDPHMHSGFTFFDTWTDVGPFALASFAEVVAKLRDAVRSVAPGGWIRANQFDLVLTKGTERIDRTLLDQIAPDNPLFLYESNGHVAYVNTKALQAAGITRDTPDPCWRGSSAIPMPSPPVGRRKRRRCIPSSRKCRCRPRLKAALQSGACSTGLRARAAPACSTEASA